MLEKTYLLNINRLRCGSGPESLAYLRHRSISKSSRSIVSSVVNFALCCQVALILPIKLIQDSFTARSEPYFSDGSQDVATGTTVASIGQVTSS